MVAENHSNLILNALLPTELGGMALDQSCKDTAAQLVKTALDCSSMPGYFPVHETCSEVTFSFWYLLQVDYFVPRQEQIAKIHPSG